MLKTVAITPDRDVSNQLREMLSESRVARLGRALDKYPSEKELDGFLRGNCPSIVFLDLVRFDLALAAANRIEVVNAGTQIIALSSEPNQDILVATMRAGIREIVPLPLEEHTLLDAVARVGETLMRHPMANQTTDRVFCFMPAKPGNGASTIAVNASLALARLAPQRALLVDLDVNQGVTSFLLKLTNPHSIRDAMENSSELDDSLWSGMVESRENLDILGSSPPQDTRFDGARMLQVIEYARQSYGAICVDLSGNMEEALMDLLRDSSQIFLVCTQDITGLHLAKLKAELFRTLNLSEQVSVILNRTEKRATFSIQEIEKMLGLRVRFKFPKDDGRVNDALTRGAGVDRSSDLGKEFEALARYMLSTDTSVSSAPQPHKFTKYFSGPPKTVGASGKTS